MQHLKAHRHGFLQKIGKYGRVDSSCEENLRGYFVNHKEMITTHECPPPPEPGEKHFLARSMPDHRSFTGELMKVVDSR